MWVLKVRFHSKDHFLHEFANKFKISYSGYPLNLYEYNGKYYLNLAGTITCTDLIKKELKKTLKKSKQILNFELNDNFLIFSIEQPERVKCLYSSDIIYIKPITISNEYYQEYYLASFKKSSLSKVLDINLKNVEYKVLKFKKEKIGNINITNISTKLTKQQDRALDVAFKSGYYEFPREIDLRDLAIKNNLSLSTFQAHLRKAEKKIMNFFFEYIKK